MNGQEKHVLIEEWYRQYARVLLLYACQFVDYHSAEEVVQETFRVAWETVREKEIEYPRTWLQKTAKNVIKNRIRERERWRNLLSNVDEVPEEALGKSEDPIDVELEYGGLIDRQDLHLLRLLAIDGYISGGGESVGFNGGGLPETGKTGEAETAGAAGKIKFFQNAVRFSGFPDTIIIRRFQDA